MDNSTLSANKNTRIIGKCLGEVIETFPGKHPLGYFEGRINALVHKSRGHTYQAYFTFGETTVYGPSVTDNIMGRFAAINALEAWLFKEKPNLL